MYTNLRGLIIPLLFCFTPVFWGVIGIILCITHAHTRPLSSLKTLIFWKPRLIMTDLFNVPSRKLGMAGREVPNGSRWREDAQRRAQKHSR